MARTLPWLSGVAPSSSAANTNKVKKGPRSIARTDARSPSSSPPPTPPSQSMMRNEDKSWIMVEDELLATAKTFTRHLHVAEYKRLHNAATRRNLVAIRKIERPVDTQTSMSVDVRLKKKTKEQQARINARLEDVEESYSKRPRSDLEERASSEEELVIGDRNLAGLMAHGGWLRDQERRNLTNIIGTIRPNTKAHASTPVAVDDDTTEDEDDLDAQPRKSILSSRLNHIKSTSLAKYEETHPTSNTATSGRFEQNDEHPEDELKTRVKRLFKSDKLASVADSSKNANVKRNISLDEIPTFTI